MRIPPTRSRSRLKPTAAGSSESSIGVLSHTVKFGRVEELKKIPCTLRFLSCEPLLEDISEIDLQGIGWVLCGGMSGPLHKDRSMDLRWAAALYQTARAAGVPFLFKQVSHNLTERGINALGLLLAQRSGKPADPERVDCIRQYPKFEVPFMPPAPKGVRWSGEDGQSTFEPTLLNPFRHSCQSITEASRDCPFSTLVGGFCSRGMPVDHRSSAHYRNLRPDRISPQRHHKEGRPHRCFPHVLLAKT